MVNSSVKKLQDLKVMHKKIIVFSLFVTFWICFLIVICSAENVLKAIERYFALKEGNNWTYKLKIIENNKKDGLSSEKEGISVNEIISVLKTKKYIITETQTMVSDLKEPLFFYSIVIDNKVYSFNPNMAPGFVSLRYDVKDIEEWLKEGHDPSEYNDLAYKYPLQIGQRWKGVESEGIYKIEKQEDIVTPAGEFKDCYKINYKSRFFESTEWFCPGIGSVKTKWRNTGQLKTYGITELVGYQIK